MHEVVDFELITVNPIWVARKRQMSSWRWMEPFNWWPNNVSALAKKLIALSHQWAAHCPSLLHTISLLLLSSFSMALTDSHRTVSSSPSALFYTNIQCGIHTLYGELGTCPNFQKYKNLRLYYSGSFSHFRYTVPGSYCILTIFSIWNVSEKSTRIIRYSYNFVNF